MDIDTKTKPETATQNEVASQPAVQEAPKAVAEPKPAAAKPAKTAKPQARKRKPAAKVPAVAKVKKVKARRVAKTRRPAARKAAAPRIERTTTMTFDATKLFNIDALPGADKFQTLFADAGERSQDLVKKGQKVAGELADLTRANVEAVVEASRVAAEGARTIGQDVVAKQRDSFEQAADAIRSFAEAKSPTEYLQLQGDFARASFDRMVSESSKLTETMVKLAGEAFQPLSNRATANAERFNTLVA